MILGEAGILQRKTNRLRRCRTPVEIYQLRTFAAVASAGHLTRAAERLHVSQPAVSAHIKSLEDALGVRLFARHPGGMVLTRAGRELLGHAEQVLAAAQAMHRAGLALTGRVAGHLRIGTLSDPEFIRLGELLARTLERHPLIELELQSEVSGAALEAVREGALDASFYFGDLCADGIARLALSDLTYRVAGPAAWRSRIAGADWSEVAALPWIVAPPVSTHNRLLNAFFGERGARPTKVIESDNEAVISNLIQSEVGLSLLREDLALRKQSAGEVCVWGEARLCTTLWFVYPAAREADPALAALLAVLRETWQLAPLVSPSSTGRGTDF
jgi:DNA-binding transcriptional LysR family regulator